MLNDILSCTSLLGSPGKVLVEAGAAVVDSMKRCWKLCPRLMEVVLAGSKMNPLLVIAEPISYDGSTSVITYLRKCKNCCATASERSENMRNNSEDTKACEEGRTIFVQHF